MPLPAIVFEDDALVAFDKPSGLPVAPDRRLPSGENLLALGRAQWGPDLANVQRLETEASGLVLFAKTKTALDFLSGQFQSKSAGRTYLALAVGGPPEDEFTVDLFMKEDEARPGVMCVVKKHGLTSRSDFTVREKYPSGAGRPGLTLLECRPLTGRPHQIRLHLAQVGAPLLNDPVYGDDTRLLLSSLKRGYKGREEEKPLIGRLALHATGLAFKHPRTREPFVLQAPLAKDFEVALKYLRKFSAIPGRR